MLLHSNLLNPTLICSAVHLALLQRAVDFVQSLFDTQGSEAGRRVLVPALLHQLHQRRQRLGERERRKKKERGKKEWQKQRIKL